MPSYFVSINNIYQLALLPCQEREKKFVLPLEGLKQRGGDTGFFSKKPTFVIFHTDPRANVYKDHKTLELAADSVDAMESWKAALLRAGVFPERTVNADQLVCL
ncbi:unnamed protein product [Protopolystoma xenopodis]|uniref:PH domain-containing protein n=1 Tax=Protopolystoma xenopodis TaxID=117903 RepID=A0A3S4ZRM1_9PLAT|nr:unnamed protein product [Protopolystoma xenopodis]